VNFNYISNVINSNLYINYTLHSITWENVINYNYQLQLPITITPTLVTTKYIMGFDMLQNKMHILVT